ncbi:hypothetical protein [Acidithiobacillus sp.]|uniref:hypothetical protein n=1 Tax=Acidithiobacillus sp. TaxID=1872118 RepID=UPI0025879B8B|nr:hypothetical protein [Acidithiobacillus sp.]MDD5375824.1 hypothetical protein [Acidithiobacillus sp.]
MTKDRNVIRIGLQISMAVACLTLTTYADAEKVTEPVPDSPHANPALRAKIRSGQIGSTLEEQLKTLREARDYANAPGDFTKNGDVPEYDVIVAGLNHFKKFITDYTNPSITDWDRDLKLPEGCRWIPNPPALAPVIIRSASVNAPTHTSKWRVISCVAKVKSNKKMKSVTYFYRLYSSITSGSADEAISLARQNLRKYGYDEVTLPTYPHDQNDRSAIFSDKVRAAIAVAGASSETVPATYINHPDKLTKYTSTLHNLKNYLQNNGKITTISIYEVSLTPLDAPLKPIRGLDTAVAGLPKNH